MKFPWHFLRCLCKTNCCRPYHDELWVGSTTQALKNGTLFLCTRCQAPILTSSNLRRSSADCYWGLLCSQLPPYDRHVKQQSPAETGSADEHLGGREKAQISKHTSSGRTQSPTSASVKGLMLSKSLVSCINLERRICTNTSSKSEPCAAQSVFLFMNNQQRQRQQPTNHATHVCQAAAWETFNSKSPTATRESPTAPSHIFLSLRRFLYFLFCMNNFAVFYLRNICC